PSTSAHRSALGPAPPLGPNRGNVGPPISSSLITQMSGPGVTSASIFSFWIDVPVCRPPFGNDTHLPHSGRMHSCPNTLELAINAAKTTKPRIHFPPVHGQQHGVWAPRHPPAIYSTPFARKAARAAGLARNFTNAPAPSRLTGAAEGAAA